MKKNIVLVVDDDPQICRLLVLILEDFEVLSAHSSSEALKILRSNHIDLVITDMQMERLDAGIRLMNHCDHVGTPVLMMSASGLSTEKEQQIVAGRFLDKPFNRKKLFEAIESELESHENVETVSFHEALVSA